MVTLPNDLKEPVSAQSSLSDFCQKCTPCTEGNNYLHGTNASLNDEMKFLQASSCAPSPVIHD